MIDLILVGACGRMGKEIARLAVESADFKIYWAKERNDHPELGRDIGELVSSKNIYVKVESSFPSSPLYSVVVDFSSPKSTVEAVLFACDAGLPFLSGTTGLSDDEMKVLKECSSRIPVLYGANMSVGMNVVFKLVEMISKLLKDKADVEIIEYHHKKKQDAPSGTALKLAKIITENMLLDYPDSLKFGRFGKDSKRGEAEIGVHSVRAGSIIGRHDLVFALPCESILISHDVQSREVFARGALECARFIYKRNPGFYTPGDIFKEG